MACGFGNAILDFTELGIKIRPYELDLRLDRDKFDHCRCEISKEAGELIADKTSGDPNQPVNIYIDEDKLLRKMYMPKGALEYDNNNRDAYLKLMDPLHILKQGKLDKKYKEVTLEDVISYVWGKVKDPNGVIKDWDITDPEYSDNVQPNYEDYRDQSLFANAEQWVDSSTSESSWERLESGLGATADGVLWVNRSINNVTGIYGDIGELDFNKRTPYEAFKMIADEWELDFWVDDHRVLNIGKHEAKPNTHLVTPEDDTLNVAEYNVTEAAYPVAEVIVKGGKAPITYDFDNDGDSDFTLPFGSMSVQMWGQARVDNVENGQTKLIDNKKLADGEALKTAAEQALISSMSRNKSGNIVFNPSVSGFTEFAQPHTVTIGDMMIVDNPPGSCDNFDDDGGQFLVNSVNHKIRGGQGWELSVEVGLIPKDDIRSQFIMYDLDEDEVLENGEQHKGLEDFEMFII